MKDLNRITRIAVAMIFAVAAVTTASALAQDTPQAGPLPGGPPPFVRAAGLFKTFDANGDGALTADETPAPAWEHLSAADSNEDKKVTRKEYAEAAAAQLIAIFDTASGSVGKDGELTKDEVPPPAWEHISTADADNNGKVSKAELAAVLEERAENGLGIGELNGRP